MCVNYWNQTKIEALVIIMHSHHKKKVTLRIKLKSCIKSYTMCTDISKISIAIIRSDKINAQ